MDTIIETDVMDFLRPGIRAILSKYEMKIENLQREVNNAQKVLHPNFPRLFIKFDLPKNIPNEKRKDIEKKLM